MPLFGINNEKIITLYNLDRNKNIHFGITEIQNMILYDYSYSEHTSNNVKVIDEVKYQ
jgi:hypothetical protein